MNRRGLVIAGVALMSSFILTGCRSATTDTTSGSTMVAKAGLEPSAEPPAWFEDRYETGVAVEGAVVGQLALQLGVDEATVESRGAAPVLFRDTALGCPGESEFVTGAEIRGWIAYYEVNGLLYRVHGLPSGEFRLCEVPDFDVIPELDR